MGRRRDIGNTGLPDYVYPRPERGCYFYRPYIGSGKFGKRQYLCSIDAPMSEVWQAYESLNVVANDDLRWLLDTYNNSEKIKKKSSDTRSQYEGYRNKLTEIVGAKGSKFGDLKLTQITRIIIRRYLDIAEFKVAANREIQYLKAAWNWASQRYSQVSTINPCAGVELNEENTRTRCPEEWELEFVEHLIICTTRSHYLYAMMELAYLCRLRCIEVRTITQDCIEGDYLRVKRAKGSLGELTKITPRLRAALNMALTMHPKAPVPIKGNPYIIHNQKGLMISKNCFDSAWQRLMKKAVNVGMIIDGEPVKLTDPFHFHDIKAMGITDHPENYSGHLSESSRQKYIRRLRKVEATR